MIAEERVERRVACKRRCVERASARKAKNAAMAAALVAGLNKVKLPSYRKNPVTGEYEETEVAPQVFEHDGVVHVSAEHGDGAADYYGEFRGGYPWINPAIEAAAVAAGFFIEWVNPGAIAFYPT